MKIDIFINFFKFYFAFTLSFGHFSLHRVVTFFSLIFTILHKKKFPKKHVSLFRDTGIFNVEAGINFSFLFFFLTGKVIFSFFFLCILFLQEKFNWKTWIHAREKVLVLQVNDNNYIPRFVPERCELKIPLMLVKFASAYKQNIEG